MVMPFNADEVFEMAEQIERNGARFYRAAAKKIPEVSQVFSDLAAMEDEHEKTFAAINGSKYTYNWILERKSMGNVSSSRAFF